ncbi:MAG: RHS repeat protein, partial [Clostridia bacterium]|nr:RHS repeat protein [Clostridia bacterium]
MENNRNLLTKRSFSVWVKTVACILSILLVMYAVPTIVYAELIDAMESVNTTDETVPVEEKEIEKGTVFEVVDRREETVKHFRTEDGSFTAVQYNVPVHEKDENGEWQDIDNTLSESGNEYATSNARIKFAKKTTGNSTLFELHDGNRKITISLSGARKKVEGQVTNTQTEFPEDATQLQKMMTLDKLSSKILYPNILDGVDLEYVVNSCNIKENIIVKERADSYSYTFEIQLNNLDAVLCEDGSVAISDPDTDEVVYMIPKGYMFDADGAYSDAVVYTLTNGGSGKYTLTVTADAEWINDESRTLPVTIDPPITVSSETGITDTYIDSDNPSSAYYSFSYLASGTGAVGQEFISYWRSSSLPTIPDSAFVVSAEFSLYCRDYRVHTGTASSIRIGAYQVTSDWNASITWTKHASNNAGAFASTTLIDYADVSVASEGKYVSWDITRLYKQWNGGTPNYGIALAQLKQGGNDALLASSETANDPRLIVCYRDMKGIESYWSSSSHGVGTAGSGYVNHANGNLVFSIGTLATTDSLFNYMPALVYNSALTDKYNYNQHNVNVPYRFWSSGYGWKLNTNESIVKPKDADYYIWSDGDGTEHYFLPDTSSTPTVYRDEDGLLLTLTAGGSGYTMKDINGNIRYFEKITTGTAIAEGGILKTITDIYGNELHFSLNDYDQTTAVSVTPNGHDTPLDYLTFTYNSLHALTEIRNSFTQQVVSFLYASSYTNTTSVGSTYAGPLCQVKFGHLSGSNIVYDATMTYTYTSAMGTTYGNIYRLATATDDSTGLSIHYTYDTSGRVATVTEYSGTTVGQSIRYTYGTGYTEIRSSGSDDILQTNANSDDIITHYSFDNQGRSVSTYSTCADRTAMYGATNQVYTNQNDDGNNTVNGLKFATVIDSVATNHIYNGGFDLDRTIIKGWGKSSANVKVGFDNDRYNYILQMTTSANGTEYVYQDVTLAAGTYTLSAECKAAITGMDFVMSVHEGTSEIASETYSVADYLIVPYAMNPSLTFTLAETKTVRVKLTSKGATTGSGILSVENVSLVNTIGIPSYNMVQFGGFDDMYADTNGTVAPIMVWQTMVAPGAAISTDGGLFGKCLRISGNANWIQRVTQRITILPDGVLDPSGPGDISTINPIYYQDRAFTVSGFAKADAQVANEDALFALSVSVYYYGESEPKKIDIPFNKDLTDWQFVSETIFVPSDKIVQHIDISCVYANQPNVAYFDNISLVEEKGVNAANYVYNDKGLPEFTYTPADCTYYEYDGNNNLILVLDSQGNGCYYHYSGRVLLSETTFIYMPKKWDLSKWYNDSARVEGASVLSAAGLLCAVITKTEYNINAYGLNTSTVTYDATGSVTNATQKSGTPRLSSSATYNLTEGSKLFGRVTSIKNTNGNTTAYEYDARGRLLYEANTAHEGLYYSYDALGRVSSVTPIFYWASLSVFLPAFDVEKAQYTYDPQTNRLSQISTATATYTFSYDAFGNTSQIKVGDQLLAGYTYHAGNGKLWKLQYGTNEVIEYKYDELDRIREICYTDDEGVPQSYKYVYATTGAIHSVECTESGRLYLYNYDSKGQLVGYTECGKDDSGDYVSLLQNYYWYDEKDRIA